MFPVVAVVVLVLLSGWHPGNAAEFEFVSETTDSDSTDSTDPPCATVANVASGIAVDPDFGLRSVSAGMTAVGEEGSCDEQAFVTLGGSLTMDLVPEVGESPGDPVTLCASVALAVEAEVDGDAESMAAAGGFDVMTQPARILQNGSAIVAVPTIEVGVFGTGADSRSYACQRQFVAPIGSRFVLEGGTRAQSNLLGIAEAEAGGDATIRLDIGVCSNGATPVCPTGVSAPVRQIPTLGYWGRLAVILPLAAAGLVAIRRRVAA
ncbi:hypothetical protein [Thioalkalivibrio thiocyanodenitrificans]|uniref:hypothetical protein n=1 Tax=Thioalkalivibrio thiocyanodenitrificans TaxID=243063 RepID=UPI00035E3FE1|nr:hypothetical protein [Thioalkalivibrio thiocyanodenitrificans]